MNVKKDTSRVNSEHWENFYANNRNLQESTFCKEVREMMQEDYIIVDIGCGSGRDSFSFAAAGFDVFAIDRSYEAITANKQLAIENPTAGSLDFKQIDLSDVLALNEYFAYVVDYTKASQKKIAFYLRFLLHAIDDETEKVLLDAIVQNAASGTCFVAEFRTTEDEEKSKVYDDHYRRFICTDEFLIKMRNRGFEINKFYKGTGLSIYKEEDPFLARVFAMKE